MINDGTADADARLCPGGPLSTSLPTCCTLRPTRLGASKGSRPSSAGCTRRDGPPSCPPSGVSIVDRHAARRNSRLAGETGPYGTIVRHGTALRPSPKSESGVAEMLLRCDYPSDHFDSADHALVAAKLLAVGPSARP
jgi:hypothetical protein